MPPTKTLVCWSCKQEVELPERIMRADNCPKCDQPLKCCYNCQFYDRSAHHQCTEPQAEWVRYKEKANLCDWFRPRQAMAPKSTPPPEPKPPSKTVRLNRGLRAQRNDDNPVVTKKDKAKAAWDNLFKE